MSEVLVIDDEPSVGSALKLILEDSGYRVAVALNGHDGIEQARRKRFCLTITDMCLPDMTGLAVIDSLRGERSRDNFILITSHSSDEISFAARECGVPLLLKPFPPSEILRLMATTLAECGRTLSGS
jgi:DNA-binding response OmpR family regulator